MVTLVIVAHCYNIANLSVPIPFFYRSPDYICIDWENTQRQKSSMQLNVFIFSYTWHKDTYISVNNDVYTYEYYRYRHS
jgi:hypothetical protein